MVVMNSSVSAKVENSASLTSQRFYTKPEMPANLFELVSKKSAQRNLTVKLIFGNDGKNAHLFYHDEEENIWVGSVTYNEKISLTRIYEE